MRDRVLFDRNCLEPTAARRWQAGPDENRSEIRDASGDSLLSPRRVRQGKAKKHEGKIIPLMPNVMWGTGGARVFTLDYGWVWVFSAVEHWNAECVGWYVCEAGSRFAALEPISQGLERIYGSVEAEVARGLSLQMDHGSQYLSDHFQKQIRQWGITPSFGFVEDYNTHWRPEKLGFRTPVEARREHVLGQAA